MSTPKYKFHPADALVTLQRRCAAIGVVLAAVLGCASGVQVYAWSLRSALEPGRALLRLNPNHAAPEELALLPGIGPRLAERIVEFRQTAPTPAFRAPEDLEAVPGIGPGTLARLRAMLRFDLPAEAVRADSADRVAKSGAD